MGYEGLTGKVITPFNPAYEKARQEYNKAIDEFPIAIVYCYTSQDVANAIHWSRKNCIVPRIRSGGHNYEGYSTGTGKLVIDTTLMNGIKVDTDQNIVKVQAGTRLKNLYETLYEFGYAFPGGTCPTVAISGLVLGGGIGLSMRYLGLTADSLVEAKMVDADGNLLLVNQCHNPDLFWALRGAGGGNFGVVTSYKFKLKKKVDKITLIQLAWNDNKPARFEFLSRWQDWLVNLDRRISAFGRIYKQGASVNAFFYGKPEEAKKIIEPLLRIPGLSQRNIEYIDFIEAVNIIGQSYERTAFEATGRFVEHHFSKGELKELINIMNEAPTDYDSYISVYSLGGAVRDLDQSSTAFFYRSANYIMAITSDWENEAEASIHKAWVAKGFNYIKSITTGSYVNFPYSRLTNYEVAYYGEYAARLACVKKKYDPCNVFSFPQSIKPSCC